MAALGRKNSGLSMPHNHDNKDVAAPISGFQIVIFPRFVANSDALCFALFCKSRAGRPVPGSIDRLNCGQFGAFHRKSADFSRNVANVHALATRRRDAFLVSSLSSSTPLERRRLGGGDIFKRPTPGAFSAPFLRRTLSTRPRKLRSKTKPGLCGRALHRRRNDALLHRGDLPELALERLVGLPGEVGIKLAELGRFRHKALIGALGIVGLHLDRLFERLRANEFLGRGGALLEHLLGIVRDLDRDRLQTLRKRAERPQRRIHIVLTQLLHLVDIPDHVVPLPAASPFACDFRTCLQPASRINGHILHRTKMSRLYLAVQYGSPLRGLTLLQSASPSLRRVPRRAAVKSRVVRNRTSGNAKKVGTKVRKPPFLTRPIASPRHDRGVSASHGARRGTRTGEISCCGSGPEPVTGFVGVCAVLLLLFSRYQTTQPRPRLTRISSWMPIPARCCTRPIRTRGATRHRSPKS